MNSEEKFYDGRTVEIDEKEFGMSRDQLYETLKKYNIFTRRYFYPLVCDFACYKSVAVKDPLTVARKISERILTLPTYYDLALGDVEKICDIIVEIHSKNRRSLPKSNNKRLKGQKRLANKMVK